MAVHHSGGKAKVMGRLLSAALTLCGVVSMAQADPRLFAAPPHAYIEAGKPVILDVYLYNEGNDPVTLPPLRFTSAKWWLNDPTGQKLSRSGESRTIADHGISDVTVPPGGFLHHKMELSIKGEPGDLVLVTLRLGKERAIESNPVLLYFSK
jgi:hypothetical protein